MYLDRDKSYYYKAYVADGGGTYTFQLGLFGKRAKFTQTEYPDLARREHQNIVIVADETPIINVCRYFSFTFQIAILILKRTHYFFYLKNSRV